MRPWPRSGLAEIRASGLWADAIEEERGQRWTIGLEAFALAVDDPDDTVGRRVPIGFDLEWERSGPDLDGRTPGPGPRRGPDRGRRPRPRRRRLVAALGSR